MVSIKKIVLAPINSTISVDDEFVLFAKTQFIKIKDESHIKINDELDLMMLGHKIHFKVVDLEPGEGKITEETEFEIREKPDSERIVEHLMKRYPKEFVAKIISGGRITIPEEYRDLHNLEEGDILAFSFKIIKKK